jgi:hypothetical protein
VSQSKLLYDWPFTANQFVLATSPLRPTTNNFIFQLNTCGYNPYVTSSPSSRQRGWVCHLQLLLVLTSAVIIRSEFRGTHGHILLSQIRDSPNLDGQVSVFISPRNKVAQLYPQALSSLFVASYDSQGYGGGIRSLLHTGYLQMSMLQLLYDWQFTVNQLVLASSPLRLTIRDSFFFFRLSPYVTSSLTRFFFFWFSYPEFHTNTHQLTEFVDKASLKK